MEEKLFVLLNEVLPDGEFEPLSFNNAVDIFDAFRTFDFSSCCSVTKLDKARLWLHAFLRKLNRAIFGPAIEEVFLRSLGINYDDPDLYTICLNLTNEMEEYVQSINIIHKDLNLHPEKQSIPVRILQEYYTSLRKFVDRAELMRQDVGIQSFCNEVIESMKQYFIDNSGNYNHKMISDLTLNRTKNTKLPFWILCSSSGTGKSQMAYTFPLPTVYFLMGRGDRSSEQEIYAPFHQISKEFESIYFDECDDYSREHMKDDDLSISSLRIAKFQNGNDFKFKTIGFIVFLFEKMVEMKNKNCSMHWLECQWNVDRFEYIALSISDGIEKLAKLHIHFPKNDHSYPFCFILDECTVKSIDERRHFRFLRNLMRALNICFVGMGTNAGSCNFADSDSGKLSRRTQGVWCHFIFRLPRTAEIILQKIVNELQGLLASQHGKSNFTIFDEEFIENLFNFMKSDRPLFIVYAYDKIKSVIMEKTNYPATDLELFWHLVEYIHNRFVDVKKSSVMNFFIGQFSYFTKKFWDGIPTYFPKSKRRFSGKLREIILSREKIMFCHPGLVSEHLALVGIPPILLRSNSNILDLYVKCDSIFQRSINKDFQFFCSISGHSAQECFHHFSRYADFNQEPIAGLAFSLPFYSFPEGRSVISALYATLERFSPQPYLNTPAYNGHLLEIATTTACVVSSHIHGFDGVNFVDWLPYFCDELCFCTFFDPHRSNRLIDNTKFSSICSKILIPYFTPQISTKFESTLKQQLSELLGNICVGEMNCNVDSFYGSRDFNFTFNNRTILNGECKLWDKTVNFNNVKKILENFNQFKGDKAAFMHIIVARKFSEFNKFNFPSNFVIYKIKCSSYDQLANRKEYSIEHVFESEDSLEPKHNIRGSTKTVDQQTELMHEPHSTNTERKYKLKSQSNSEESGPHERKCVLLLSLEEIADDKDEFEFLISKFRGLSYGKFLQKKLTSCFCWFK